MVIETLEYKNFKGIKVKRECLFNLTKSEWVDLQVSEDGGFEDLLKKISNEKDTSEIVRIFKKIILAAYGELKDDGETFLKTPEITKRFECSAAFEALYMSFITDSQRAAEFCNQLMPKFTDAELEAINRQKEEQDNTNQ